MWKVDQKWKCIKLKSVQILLKSVKISPKVKFIQILLKITSIVPNLTFKGHPVQRSWGQLKDYIHVYDFLFVFHVKFGQNMHHSDLIYWMFYDHFYARSLLAKLGMHHSEDKAH